MQSINQELRRFITENFLFGQDQQLSDEDSFLEKGTIDSTGMLELVAFLEEHFQITIDADELVPENLDSIRTIATFLGKKLQAVGLEK